MNKHVRFLKPFIYCDVVAIDMTDTLVTINANPNVEGYLNEDVFDVLKVGGGLGLVEEIV